MTPKSFLCLYSLSLSLSHTHTHTHTLTHTHTHRERDRQTDRETEREIETDREREREERERREREKREKLLKLRRHRKLRKSTRLPGVMSGTTVSGEKSHLSGDASYVGYISDAALGAIILPGLSSLTMQLSHSYFCK
jgi:DNA segregation ATPase FtsK/SpoIIIE-like protein